MLSDNIRNYRKKNSMSQDDLAEKLGVSRQSVSLWETGQSQPTIENILALSKIFDISTDTLLKDEDEQNDIVEEHSDTVDDRSKKTPDQKKKNIIISACVVAAILIVGVTILLAFTDKEQKKDLITDADTTDDPNITTTTYDTEDELLTEETDTATSDSATTTPAESTHNSGEDPSTQNNNISPAVDEQPPQTVDTFDLFTYCKDFAIEIGELYGDYTMYQQPSELYGGNAGEYFSLSYWADSDMVEFCLHCPLSDTQSINFYLRMRGGYDHQYEYLSSRYYRDSGTSIRDLSGYIDPSVFSAQYPISWETYNGDGGIDKQNSFIEESRVGMCDLIRCLKEFVRVENMECSFSDFEFANF